MPVFMFVQYISWNKYRKQRIFAEQDQDIDRMDWAHLSARYFLSFIRFDADGRAKTDDDPLGV